ncbi:competence type IV pilus major pilin ComGC [Dielma fastidiosa]|uniref:Prepilin-type N-terminal cleavage/methylation domain-containing protein n=1 Tax=Dielma fastidiosa TaxID=1034346 RepID=A0AB35URD8_9FIRM|nr:type II secretion system protein [Dielma fastidiosa]MDY5169199.1 prepilin-type N-terminal cleavage/methylation domain-containing protein [Dielma fastidiosa]
MKNKKGFTLIELIVVIAILGILALFLVPSFLGYTKDAQKATCEANRHIIERSYTFYKAKSADEITLSKYIDSEDGKEYQGSKCPAGGVYTYDDDKVICSIHGEDEDKNEGTGEESGDGDKSEDSDPEESTTPKIPGTDLDINYDNVVSVVKGESINAKLERGTIVEMKDEDGKVISYYIVKDQNWIDKVTGPSFTLIEITNDPAITVNGTDNSAISSAIGGTIKRGQKIVYDNKYYIYTETWWNTDANLPGKYSDWLEIK